MADEEISPKRKKGELLKILILLILIGGAGGAAYVFLWPMFMNSSAQEETAQEEAGSSAPAKPQSSNIIVSLPTFMVNLADPLGRRYIKLTIEVEMNSQSAAEELQNNTAKARDSINLLLSSKSYADLAPAENKILLKNEIVER
jgi:Flagellar basal body-associated protein